MVKPAINARASTAYGRQTTANQGLKLQCLAGARAFEVVVFEEQKSVAKAKPVLERVLAEARAGRSKRSSSGPWTGFTGRCTAPSTPCLSWTSSA